MFQTLAFTHEVMLLWKYLKPLKVRQQLLLHAKSFVESHFHRRNQPPTILAVPTLKP
jgi:hypothetical protein